MDKYVILKKSNFDSFIKKLANASKVVAPTNKGYNNFAFDEVTSAAEIALDYIPTILPPKKYFMPQQETILKYDKQAKDWTPVVESEDLILFGVHTCDLAGIQCLDLAFSREPKDVNYFARKDKITIIGLECNDYCDEYANCKVMNNHMPHGGYDLLFTDISDYFMVHINTEKGDNIVASMNLFEDASDLNLKELKKLRDSKAKIFKDEVSVSHNDLKPSFEKSFDHPIWKDIQNKCLACGNCTNVCPTCYCFDIKDDISLDFNTGIKTRIWDSCQNESFAEVAGGENFRKKRSSRQLHRYMRKFNYPAAKYDRYFCTGCGRCSRTCMAKINLKETIESLQS